MKKTANGQDTFNLIYESRLYSFFIIDNNSIRPKAKILQLKKEREGKNKIKRYVKFIKPAIPKYIMNKTNLLIKQI